MSSVDNRIVKMGFENSKFISAANATMGTLKKLSDSLKLTEGTKGFENINKAAKNVDIKGLSNGVDEVSRRFSALDIAGVTALVNIANSAVNTGKSLLSSLTIDPILTGFDEYETKMNAIQTILTNTAHAGTTMDQVTNSLDALNEYADKTIYNFAEMTRNIGTFTAAGVGLEDSVAAIKGIANLAAGSGSTSAQASTAMYQLSQALASGTVNLQDWNSVVNAGMGGKMFQDALRETGLAMGANIDMAQSFRESISSKDGTGWLTSDILLATLKKFADDPSLMKAATEVKTFTGLLDTMKESVQSGWAKTWEYIIGDKTEAAEFFTAISNGFNSIIGPSTDARNNMLKFWNENGGRDDIIKALANSFKFLSSMLTPLRDAFREVFPPKTGQMLVDISKKIKNMSENLKLSDKTIDNLKKTFKGFFSIIDTGIYVIKTISSGILAIAKSVLPASDSMLSITGAIGEFVSAMSDAIQTSGVLKYVVDIIAKAISSFVDLIKNAIDSFVNFLSNIGFIDTSKVSEAGEAIVNSWTPLTSLGQLIEKSFDTVKAVLSDIIEYFFNIASKVTDACGRVFDTIKNTLGGDNSSITSVINTGIFGVLVVYIGKFLKFIKDLKSESGGFMDGIVGILEGFQGVLEGYQNNLNASALTKIATAIGILAVALFVIASIDPDRLAGALTAMAVMFGELFLTIALFDKFMGAGSFKGLFKVTSSMILLSVAVLIMAKAVKEISEVDMETMFQGLLGVAVAMKILTSASKSINKDSKGMIKSAIAVSIMAGAILILSKSVEKLGGMDIGSLTKGLIGVGLLVAGLSIFMKTTDISGMSISKATGILIFSAAMLVLSKSIEKLSTIKFSSMIKGLMGLAGIMTVVTLFVKSTSNVKGTISTAIGLTILGGAILILANGLEKLGAMDLVTIGTGLLTMAAVLGVISLAVKSIPKNTIGQAIGISILAGALLLLTQVIKTLGDTSWETIGKGLLTIAAVLGIISLASKSMGGLTLTAVGMIAMATAIAMLTPPLILLGSMKLSSIGKSLLVLAGGFTVIGVAAYLLAPVTPVLLGLAASIAIFGIACVAVGAGMLMFATGLTALAAAGAAGVTALVAVVSALIGLIPSIARALAEGIIEFIKIIVANTPVILSGIDNILSGMLTLFINNTPLIVGAVMTLIITIVKELSNAIPIMIESAMQMIGGILTGVANNIEKIVTAGIDVVLNFIKGVNSRIGDIVDAAFKTVISFINGLADAIRNNHEAIRSACWNLITAVVGAITSFMGDVIDIGADIVGGIVTGIKNSIWKVVDAVKGLASDALEGAKKFLGINSPSREFMKLGNFSSEGMAKGLANGVGIVSKASDKVAASAIDTMTKAMTTVNDLLLTDSVNTPTITPVLDLSQIQNGVSSMNGMMSKSYTLGGNIKAVGNLSASLRGKSIESESGSVNNTTNNNASINNTFNITGNNPKEIANEVSMILQRQVERRSAVWA